jgi:RNA polymerase sigma-70 factor (ECF subfamily)
LTKNTEQDVGEKNLRSELLMIPPTDAMNVVPFPRSAQSEASAKISDIEYEVLGLFEQFRVPLLRYVTSIGLSTHDGEEITQEVFLALFQHLRSGKSRQNLRGWIFRVAHNLALKQRAANQRRFNMTPIDFDNTFQQSDPSPNPEEQVLFGQKCTRLLAVLRALPENDQHCLRLRAEGLRYREIAAVLGISLGSVSISLARSLARLARAEGS